jgi:cytochrome P450
MGQSFVHLNPDIFPSPKVFDPSRWLGEHANDLESYLVPFSKGPRSCLGIKYVSLVRDEGYAA